MKITCENSVNGIHLVHPFKDKIPDVDEFFKSANSLGVINNVNSYCDRVDKLSIKYATLMDPNDFKGWSLELLVEYMIKVGAGDNRIGIHDYEPVVDDDYGVDGHGIGENQNPATVQVKFRAGNYVLKANEDSLSNFVNCSWNSYDVCLSDKKNMLIVTTALKVAEQTMEKMLYNKVRVLNREALRQMYDNRPEWWIRFYESVKLSQTKKTSIPITKLRDHQKEAVKSCENAVRGRVILPTGTGKTIIECDLALKEIKKQIANGNKSPVIKVNSSRILLCFQLFEDYFNYFISHGMTCRYANFNSGNKSDSQYAVELRKSGGLYREMISTTSAAKMVHFYEKCQRENIPLIVFSTYHSSENFDASGIIPSLTIHDEAHNLVSLSFNKAAKLPSDRDLFFTATEKVTDSDEDLGMNNSDIFGERLYNKSPKEMIDVGEMVPPYIHIVKSKTMSRVNMDMLKNDYDALTLSIEEAFFAHQDHIRKDSYAPDELGAKVLVVCEGQKDLVEMFKSDVFDNFRKDHPDVHIFALSSDFGIYIDGKHDKNSVTNMKKHELIKRIKSLKNSDQCIIFHVDMVGEGIDVPGITGVMPFRNSEVCKLIQNFGRAARLHPLDRSRFYSGEITVKDRTKWVKPNCWIIIPEFLENSEGYRGRIVKLIRTLKTEFGFIPQQHTVIDNVRGLGEEEEIDTVNEVTKKTVHTKSGLNSFTHEFETITESVVFADGFQEEYDKAVAELNEYLIVVK